MLRVLACFIGFSQRFYRVLCGAVRVLWLAYTGRMIMNEDLNWLLGSGWRGWSVRITWFMGFEVRTLQGFALG